MDWNWFFSTLAQSVAAVVGIFAAFTITKVINSQSEFKRKAAHGRELLALTQKYRENATRRPFGWCNRHDMKRAIQSLNDTLDVEKKTRPLHEYYYSQGFPLYMPRKEVIEEIGLIVVAHERTISNRASSNRVSDRSYDRIAPLIESSAMIAQRVQRRDRLYKEVDEETEKINELFVETKQHIRLLSLHLADSEDNPESSKIVSFSIVCAVLLFFVGVIYPLSFLPAKNEVHIELFVAALSYAVFSVKGAMLLTVSAIFISIMVMFWQVNRSLKYEKTEISELRKATDLGYYSEYFAIRSANVREQREAEAKSASSVS
jgi:hypothetical protein